MIIQKMKLELAALSEQDRAELAAFLIKTLDQESELDSEEAWVAELDRRAAEIQNGSAIGVPAEQVFADLREKYS